MRSHSLTNPSFLAISDFCFKFIFTLTTLYSIEKRADTFDDFQISFRWNTHLSARNHWNNIFRGPPTMPPEFRKLKLHQFHFFAKIKKKTGKSAKDWETRGHFKWLHLTDQTLRTSVKRLHIDGLIIVGRSSLFWLHYLETIDLAKTESSTRSHSGRLSNAFDFVRLCVCQWAEKKGGKKFKSKKFLRALCCHTLLSYPATASLPQVCLFFGAYVQMSCRHHRHHHQAP